MTPQSRRATIDEAVRRVIHGATNPDGRKRRLASPLLVGEFDAGLIRIEFARLTKEPSQ